jgi:hypothetical protein
MDSKVTSRPVERDDVPTVVALAVLAACITATAHEALGHGGACLAHGGRIAQLTSVYFGCKPQTAWITAAGPLDNLLTALMAWLIRQCMPARFVRARLLLILVTAFSLFWEAGYLLYGMILNQGDWAMMAHAVVGAPSPATRVAGFALGVGLYWLGMGATARAMRPFNDAHGRAGRLLRWAWLAGAVSAVAASLAYTPDRMAIRQAALEIGAAALPLLLLKPRYMPALVKALPVDRSWVWIGVEVVVYVGFIVTLGHGLP